ncbi:MAG TPA: arginase family protein [Bryobacteraceae bacterium]|nr:arginase family protein [Bryobacteraceae bacterium]
MLAVIAVPYHLGERGAAVGGGPLRITPLLSFPSTILELGDRISWHRVNDGITTAVSDAREADHFPLVLAGNCNSCLGTLAAVQDLQPGVVWFDAHGDFHTEATSISGSLEGMSLTLATTRFVSEKNVVLAGARALDPGEMERVHERLHYVPSGILQRNLPLPNRVYVHVDLDVLDPSISPGVNFQGAGGVTIEVLRDSLSLVLTRYNVVAMAITNYNPDRDVENRTRHIIVDLIEFIRDLRSTSSSR